ncbi:cysteate synthase [Pelomyxa schiedti]|nr:cysteate synthase [Pelomyxa schiedti]
MQPELRPTSYALRCLRCGKEYRDNEKWRLSCDNCATHGPALLRAEYDQRSFVVDRSIPGVLRMHEWLPINRCIPGLASSSTLTPAVWRSPELALALGMTAPSGKPASDDSWCRLWVAFSGHHPRRGAEMHSCTFKELEAVCACSRLVGEMIDKTLVVASAGNTARAFAQVYSNTGSSLVIVVPQAAAGNLWSLQPFSPKVRLVSVTGEGADYADAIKLAGLLAARPGFYSEGGAGNVARRDGMGSVVLCAAEAMGEIPQHYFQAIGSGTGAIAAHEMAIRLRADPRFSAAPTMRLHVSQNIPYTPMSDAWLNGRQNHIKSIPEAEAKARISQVSAFVLTNRTPPYSICGGVYDCMVASDGQAYCVTNEEAYAAAHIFQSIEGVDVDPAAAVALGSLRQAISRGTITASDSVLVNITGGGQSLLKKEHSSELVYLKPWATVDCNAINDHTVDSLVSQITFEHSS